jgi:L-galactose dehydrogenase
MRYRRLGDTALEVSILGFGGAPLGQEYGELDEGDGARAVAHAVERGINFFDVAPYYGRLLAEERLGRALEGRRNEVVLATKCCRYDRRGYDFSAARVHADIDACLRRLRTDRVDLFQVHDVEFGDRRQILEETLPAMREVQAAGKARYVGITGLPVHMLRALADAFAVDTVLSYCHYNLMIDDLDDVLRPLGERGVGLIAASPLHMGVLTGPGPQPWHPAPPEVLTAGRAAAALCAERGRELAEVALGFALDYPHVATTLCGMRDVHQVDANLRALDAPRDPVLLEELRALIAPVHGRTWHEGLPENAPPALRG